MSFHYPRCAEPVYLLHALKNSTEGEIMFVDERSNSILIFTIFILINDHIPINAHWHLKITVANAKTQQSRFQF